MRLQNSNEEEYKDYLDSLDAGDVFGGCSNAVILEKADPVRFNVGFSDFEAGLFRCEECDEYFTKEKDLNDKGRCERCESEMVRCDQCGEPIHPDNLGFAECPKPSVNDKRCYVEQEK